MVFHALGREHLDRIIDIQLARFRKRLGERDLAAERGGLKAGGRRRLTPPSARAP
ncbi:MAG: hypothetical protein R3F43_32325 [bacterium]